MTEQFQIQGDPFHRALSSPLQQPTGILNSFAATAGQSDL